jgi:hypothetical protein
MSNFNANLNKYNLNQNHQLSQRQQTYFLNRKLVSVHSVDRDINKWPLSSLFEIQLPEAMLNVQSIRLVQINLPANYYNFSPLNQNNKMSFTFDTVNINWSGGSSPNPAIYAILANADRFNIEIEPGFYQPNQLANEIQNRMNNAVTQYLADNGITYYYEKFVVYNDIVGEKFWFGNNCDSFTLNFSLQQQYDITNCEQPVAFYRYANWGMPFNLGYEKKDYISDSSSNSLKFYWAAPDISSCIWLEPSTSPSSSNVYYVTPPLTYNLFYLNSVYMEIDKYNQMDELYPYSERTSNLYQNDYGGNVNSSFAKISMTTYPYGQIFDSRNGLLQNMSVFDTPIERIQKLKFKFRDHNGQLIDFQNFPFDFTLEFYTLKNEIDRNYEIRLPLTYTL